MFDLFKLANLVKAFKDLFGSNKENFFVNLIKFFFAIDLAA